MHPAGVSAVTSGAQIPEVSAASVPPTPARPRPLPPSARASWPGAHLVGISRDPLSHLGRLLARHGDVVHFRIGPQHLLVLQHPDDIRDVLVTHGRRFHKGRGLERARLVLGNGLLTSEDAFHLRQRRLAQPAFHRERIAAYGETMGAYAERHARRWRDGERRDVAEDMMGLTLAIVGKTLFDADVEAEAAEIGEALDDALEAFEIAIMPFGELLEKLPLPRVRRFRRAKERLDRTIYRLIRERRASAADRGDLLSMLVAATDTEGDGTGMSDEQLRDECMTLFLAGHETTANLLTWTFHLLSRHPEVERRLHAEVDALEGTPAARDLARLPYARQVLAEAMRLYPPAWILGRRATDRYEFREWAVPPRTIVLFSQYLVHRDPRWWPAPERFDPDRWLPGREETRPKFAYFPFGAGTRICIGEQFAWMEGVLVLATIARRWRLEAVPGHEPELQPILTLRPKGGMPMVVRERSRPG